MQPTRFCQAMDSLEPGQTQHLTIIFTDIRGFSKRVEQEEYKRGSHAAVALKDEHDTLLREYLDDNSYLKSLGDGCLFLFADACAPIQRIIDLQRKFSDRYKEVPPDHRLEIRVGIHCGPVFIKPGDPWTKWQSDPLSDAVNLASRVMRSAPPGTIHLTDSVYRHCNMYLPGRVILPAGGSMHDLGEINFEGRQRSSHIWQINPFGPRIPADLSKQGTVAATSAANSEWGYLAAAAAGFGLGLFGEKGLDWLKEQIPENWSGTQAGAAGSGPSAQTGDKGSSPTDAGEDGSAKE